jgi:hypothetical protein
MCSGRSWTWGVGEGETSSTLGSRDGDVGVDHNVELVAAVHSRGLKAFVPAEFRGTGDRAQFPGVVGGRVLEEPGGTRAVGIGGGADRGDVRACRRGLADRPRLIQAILLCRPVALTPMAP